MPMHRAVPVATEHPRPDESIAQVAAACGFDSPSNFSQQFRRFYRCTPREYRLRGAARQQP